MIFIGLLWVSFNRDEYMRLFPGIGIHKTPILFYMQTPQSVAAVIFSSERKEVLLIQRQDVPVWVFPGGGVETGEGAEQAVRREVLEETGLEIKITKLVGVYTPLNRLAKHTHLYECEIIGGTIGISEETRDCRFFPLNALPKLIPPPYPDWLKDAQNSQETYFKPISSVTYTALMKHALSHPILVFRFLLARLGRPINTVGKK